MYVEQSKPAPDAVADVEREPDSEADRFSVVARDGATISTHVGLEDALCVNRTTPRAYRVLRIEDGKPMTLPRGRQHQDAE